MGKINFLVDVWVRAWAFYWTMAATLDLREACGCFHMGFLNLSTLIKKPGKSGSHLKYGPVPLPKSGWPRKYYSFIESQPIWGPWLYVQNPSPLPYAIVWKQIIGLSHIQGKFLYTCEH